MFFRPLALCLPLVALAAAAAPKAPGIRLSPGEVRLELGGGRQLQARLSGIESPIAWKVEPPSGGTVTSAGYYRAPQQHSTPATIRVTASAPGVEPASALILLQPVSVRLDQQSVTLRTGGSRQFQAQVRGAADEGVTWSVDGGDQWGSILPSGLYTAPTRCSTPATVTVRATSVADPGKSATATVQIEGVSIKIEPEELDLRLGDSRRFEAKVNGAGLDLVEWEVLGEGGAISSSGLYTAPAAAATPTVHTVIARSAADPAKSVQARVRILPVQILPRGSGGGKKKRGGGGILGTAGFVIRSIARRVSRVYLPFSPLDIIVKAPMFQDRQGKQYVPLGGGLVLGARVENSANERLLWRLDGQPIGEISEDGIYRAPDRLTTPQVVQIRATSVADPTKSVLQLIQIPPVVIEAEKPQKCMMDGVVQLAARVRNAENDAVIWSVEGGPQFGSITETGLYQPPASLTTPTSVRVRASAAADPSKSVLLEVPIPELTLRVSPSEAKLDPGRRVQLHPKVSGCHGRAQVEWIVTPPAGTITPNGVYQAPEEGGPGVVEILAVLKADPSKTARVQIRLKGSK